MPSSNPLQYKLFYCSWKGSEIPAVAARLCDYLNPDTYICRHSGELCVAKAGLEQFAQSLAESVLSTSETLGQLDFLQTLFNHQTDIPGDQSKPELTKEYFQKLIDERDGEKRKEAYAKIAKLADHICSPTKTPSEDKA